MDRQIGRLIDAGDGEGLANADGSNLELYDLAHDEHERNNLAARDPKRAKDLSQRLLAWCRSLPQLPGS